MYIQTRMAKYAEELWELLEKKDNTFVYMCGLKGMEKGIYEIMISLAAKDGKQGTFNSFHIYLGGGGGTNQVCCTWLGDLKQGPIGWSTRSN